MTILLHAPVQAHALRVYMDDMHLCKRTHSLGPPAPSKPASISPVT